MSEQNLTLTDALQIAVEAEKQSTVFYKDAAEKAANTALQRLFGRLADLEQHHYDKVTELAASLQKKGKFIVYEGYSSPIPAQSEIRVSGDAAKIAAGGKGSLMDVLTMAQDVEVQASKRYIVLAGMTSDVDGRKMFQRLAKEEQSHLRLLTEAYWNLNDYGIWKWSVG
jgi:rubrerythrin